jgi:hypothetical protein
VTTPLFEYGYGYDGARRWRKDLASNVWDWYPCGVACCAGDLATLRSTDGGATWAVLERRLDQAPVVNGEPFLGALGSGTQRFGAEAALTDALGVLRGGAYGPGLNSLLNPLRGDAGVEETLRGLFGPWQRNGKPARPHSGPLNGRPAKSAKPKPTPLKDLIKDILRKAASPLVAANVGCAIAIGVIADDIHDAAPRPRRSPCYYVCKAVEHWEDTIANKANWLEVVANFLGCEVALNTLWAACKCNRVRRY